MQGLERASRHGAWVLCLALAGCSELEGRRIRHETDFGTAEGITYYLSKPRFDIEVRELRPGAPGKPDLPATTLYDLTVSPVADDSQRFEVGLNSGWFVADSFNVVLAEDGRLVSVGVKSADETSKSVAALGDFVAGIAAVAVGALSRSRALETVKEKLDLEGDDVETQRRKIEDELREKVGQYEAADTQESERLLEEILLLLHALQALDVTDPRPASPVAERLSELLREARASLEERLRNACDKYRKLIELGGTEKGLEEQIRDLYTDISKLPTSAPSPSPAQRIAKHFAKLRTTLDEALADYVVDPGNRTPFETALEAYKVAVEIALDADEEIGGRALLERRETLIEFLKAAIPVADPEGRGQSYGEFEKHLDEVDKVLAGVIGPAPRGKAPGATAIGTLATRRFDNVHAIAARSRTQFGRARTLGLALVEYGGIGAVVVHMPTDAPEVIEPAQNEAGPEVHPRAPRLGEDPANGNEDDPEGGDEEH